MAAAFVRAGIETPRARIDRILRDAIRKHGSNTGACVAEVSRALLASDAVTVWEFFEPDRTVRLWNEVEKMIRQVRRERGLDAAPPPAPTPIREGREGQTIGADKANRGPPSDNAAGSGQPNAAGNGQFASAAPVPHASPALRQIAETSLLRTFLIEGRPIGECTAARAREWGRTRRREGKFAELLTEGLQPGMIIGEWKNDADAEQAARLARESENG